jgi:hypothetical protein
VNSQQLYYSYNIDFIDDFYLSFFIHLCFNYRYKITFEFEFQTK